MTSAARRPDRSEAPEYFFTYIDQAKGDDVRVALRTQTEGMLATLRAFGEARGGHRYAEGKWSVREVIAHLSDCERMFVFRAFWFARRLPSPLPSFDQDIANEAAGADERQLGLLVDELAAVRAGTLTLFDSLSDEAWSRTGTASDRQFSVRALAWTAAGHVEHHLRIINERYR